ncbi:glucose-6-phosphatase 3 isoform X2 [Coregonus clupeaformis]|uniref:glucose-6-phosphatase 3 isoform X2 n=1 Tax=Coregonus clupeaformis TaxID=59861 RepID=UPI001BDFCCB8|nr:glucose-6-phosphatase 3 isoform X2 [Coregonus clupeaformis]
MSAECLINFKKTHYKSYVSFTFFNASTFIYGEHITHTSLIFYATRLDSWHVLFYYWSDGKTNVGTLKSWRMMLFGERPFWWVGESHLFDKNPPKLHQFASTCETGPGSPSGHAMVTAAVWWVMASSLGSLLYSYTRSVLLSAVPYLLYLLGLVAVGLSRIFILAHFPHQVIAGSLTGFILGVVLSRQVPEGRPLVFFVSSSFGLLLSAFLIHSGLTRLGFDLSWSIALAKKWCSHSEWIRLDTAPFSSLTRDCGAILGLGLAQYWKPGGYTLPWAPRALCLALCSMALYHVHRLPLPIQPQPLFYFLFFIKFTIVPQVVMIYVPGFVHLLTHKKKKE